MWMEATALHQLMARPDMSNHIQYFSFLQNSAIQPTNGGGGQEKMNNSKDYWAFYKSR